MKAATAPLVPATPRPPGQPRGLNILGTFAHHPDLAAAFWVFNGHILNNSTLTPRQTELAVLRVALRYRSSYEWEQHLYAARACGITDEEIAAIEGIDAAVDWPRNDAVLLTAVDELIESGTVSDDTWSALSGSMNTRQVLDLIFTVGAYVAIAMMVGVAGTPLDADLIRGQRAFPSS
jgi:alkylhydroperoxidase family enzyme